MGVVSTAALPLRMSYTVNWPLYWPAPAGVQVRVFVYVLCVCARVRVCACVLRVRLACMRPHVLVRMVLVQHVASS